MNQQAPLFGDRGKRRPAEAKLTGLGTAEAVDPKPESEEGDSWEEPSGDGRTSRHPVMGVQLLKGSKLEAWIPYGAIVWGESPDVNRRVVFDALRGETLYRVVLEGEAPEFGMMADKLMEGKRISVRENGSSVTRVHVEAVPVAKGK